MSGRRFQEELTQNTTYMKVGRLPGNNSDMLTKYSVSLQISSFQLQPFQGEDLKNGLIGMVLGPERYLFSNGYFGAIL